MIELQILEPRFVDGAYEVERLCLAEGWSKSAINDLICREDALYIVAVDGDKVCGIAGMYIVLGEGQITNVAVLPEYRRRGIGKRIFGELIKRGLAHGVSVFTLEVDPCNTAAIRLYGGFGFIEAGRRKGLHDGTGAVIMNYSR